MADYSNKYSDRNTQLASGRMSRMESSLEDDIATYRRKSEQELNDLRVAMRIKGIKEESELWKKNIKTLTDFQKKQDKKRLDELTKQQLDIEKKVHKQTLKDIKEEKEARLEAKKEELELERTSYEEMTKNAKTFFKGIGGVIKTSLESKLLDLPKSLDSALSNFGKQMQATMKEFAKYQSTIDTRLQGSGKSWGGTLGYSGLYNTLMTNVGINPYIRSQDMLSNLNRLVSEGIAFNLEQRTFLATVSDKIANTFDAFDSNLARIVRLQQADTTASRLGLEAYTTRLLNSMFSDTSYLNAAYDVVSSNLVEATSQLSAQAGVEFEGVIQKWLGALSSVGLSDTAVGNLSQALGYLATGDVTGLSSSPMQNLIVMAASRAGLSYADMLSKQITLDETNTLLESVVEYLQEIGNSTNQVVKNQYASTFGVSLSDIRAARNLSARDIATLSGAGLSYGGTIDELYSQMGQVAGRTHIGEMLSNLWENAQYSLYSNIAGNPVLYALWQVTDMIQGLTGGINIPFITAMGSGVDLNTTVENLMKLGIVGVGSLGMIGDIVNGMGSTFNFGSAASRLGISKSLAMTSRGTLEPFERAGGIGQSYEQSIGQGSGDIYYKETLGAAKESAQQDLQGEMGSKKDANDIYTILSDGSAKATPIINENTKLSQLDTVIDWLDRISKSVDSIDGKLTTNLFVQGGV